MNDEAKVSSPAWFGRAFHTVLLQVAQVGTEADGVVADDLRPVVDDLELVFELDEIAVAAVHIQTGTQRREAGDIEGGCALAEFIHIQSGHAELACEIGVVVLLRIDAQPEEAEPEICQQRWLDLVIAAEDSALVPAEGLSAITADTEAVAACRTDAVGPTSLEPK